MSLPLAIAEYEKRAKERGLELVGFAPPSIYIPTQWRCIHCGKVMTKSYHAFYYSNVGCRCQSKNRFSNTKYTELADSLGIEWVGEDVPKNVYETTLWKGPSGSTVSATYYQLRHSKVKRIYIQLGIEHDE